MGSGELRVRSREFLKICAGILLLNGVILASSWAEMFLPLPKLVGMVFSLVGFAAVFVFIAAVVAPLGMLGMSFLALLRRDVRPLLPATLVLGLVGFAATVPTGIATLQICDAGFRALARKSAPLIQAIRKYETDHGNPPPDLEMVVREKYLSEIPATPCGCSDYRYAVNKRGNPWTLTVNPPFRGIGFDRFEYWPKQDYPHIGESGWYERVVDWAYYHE